MELGVNTAPRGQDIKIITRHQETQQALLTRPELDITLMITLRSNRRTQENKYKVQRTQIFTLWIKLQLPKPMS